MFHEKRVTTQAALLLKRKGGHVATETPHDPLESLAG